MMPARTIEAVSAHRATLIVAADQATSSVTNLLYVVAASALFDGSEFGAFALGSSVVGVALGIVRTTSSERLAVVSTDADGRTALLSQSLILTTLLAALAIGVLMAFVPTGPAGVWLLAAPAILLQDRLRYVALRFRPLVALVADACWFVVVMASWVLAATSNGDALGWIGVAIVAGPIVGAAVLVVGVRRRLAPTIEADRRQTAAETGYVVDSWLLSGGVLAALALVGITTSLETVGQLRLLFLFFQPFFSLAYAGRWAVMGGATSRPLDWPLRMSIAAAMYGALTGAALAVAADLELVPTVWNVGLASLALNAAAQTARAFHQGVADWARRTTAEGLVPARLTFAVVLLATIAPMSHAWRLPGAAGSLLLSFGAGAADVVRRTRSAQRVLR